jgi:hypothetical protein
MSNSEDPRANAPKQNFFERLGLNPEEVAIGQATIGPDMVAVHPEIRHGDWVFFDFSLAPRQGDMVLINSPLGLQFVIYKGHFEIHAVVTHVIRALRKDLTPPGGKCLSFDKDERNDAESEGA